MAIISQETWDKFTEEEKELTIELYSGLTNEPEDKHIIGVMNSIFGKENLHPKPKIRTWGDVEEY